MSQPDPSARSLKHPIYQGVVGTVIAAVIGAAGLYFGNTGVVADVFPGSPTATTTVTPAAVTTTVTATATATSTVTAAAPTSSVQAGGEIPSGGVRLADASSRPDDILVQRNFDGRTNTSINGRRFDFAWTSTISASFSPRVFAGINLNRSYSRFQARIGVDGTSLPSSGKIEVVADGKVIFSEEVTLQRSYDVDLAVADAQRLEIKVYPPADDSVRYAVGDPVLLP